MGNDEQNLALATPPAAAAEDERLVQDCIQGDEQAWNRLIDKYKRLIYSVPVKFNFSPDDAADVFQAVCIELFTNLHKLRKVGSLRSWLITVATHKCFHDIKRPHDMELDSLEPEVAEAIASVPAGMVENIQEEQLVRDAIGMLPERCAQLVKLLFFEQPPVPYSEVAQRLGLAVGSIGFIRGRCLNRLQKILTELGL